MFFFGKRTKKKKELRTVVTALVDTDQGFTLSLPSYPPEKLIILNY